MGKIIAKTSLYDVLSMMAVGCVLLYDFAMMKDLIPAEKIDWALFKHFFLNGQWNVSFLSGLAMLAIVYALGIINHQITDFISGWLRWWWNTSLVKDYIWDSRNQQKHYLHEHTKQLLEAKEVDKSKMMSKYYEAYNCAIVYHPHTAVLILEKQLVLLRNMVIPMIFMAFMLFNDNCCKILVSCAILIVIALISYLRTSKQVELVWEEYEAVKQLGLDTK